MSSSPPPRWLPFVVLGIGLTAISFGAVLARLAQGEGVDSLAVASWRLGLAALLVTPIALLQARHELARLSARQVAMALLAGLCLALHFATWISSLEYTSVASSTALVTTNPLWIGLASFVLFRERPGAMMAGGIALSLAGSLAIFWSDSQGGAGQAQSLLGNTLALIGSWCFSAYLLIGRRLRAGLGLPAYIWLAYGAAALFLVAASLAGGVELGEQSALAWAVLLAMALGPQLLGHTAYNWSLRHVSATFVAVVTLGEPVGSALMAFLVFGEGFAPLQFAASRCCWRASISRPGANASADPGRPHDVSPMTSAP
jgi:drug/metabolite transporter (DMT)-like permease